LTRLGLDEVPYDRIARATHFNKVDDLLAAIGAGDLKLSKALAPFRQPRPPAESAADSAKSRAAKLPGPARADFSVSGVGNVLTRTANCCSPIPGDAIVGFITSGRGVSIHRRDCANMRGLDDTRRARLVEVRWGRDDLAAWPVELRITAYDRAGLLPDITQLFQAEKVEVAKLLTQTDAENTATIRVQLAIGGLKKLARITPPPATTPRMCSRLGAWTGVGAGGGRCASVAARSPAPASPSPRRRHHRHRSAGITVTARRQFRILCYPCARRLAEVSMRLRDIHREHSPPLTIHLPIGGFLT